MCATVSGRIPLVGTVIGTNPTTVRVEQILDTRSQLARLVALSPGDVVGGSAVTPMECVPRDFTPSSGVRVFVEYRPSSAVQHCAEAGVACDGGAKRGAALTSGEIVLAPLGTEIDFGDGVRVPLADMASLTDETVCLERYPAPAQ